ncbi:MAG TPA: ornithine carbamoyltransferase [Actinomycetota bacterium]|nr:ornithine carbamoyltransferase [Actinomycetota bacterium]
MISHFLSSDDLTETDQKSLISRAIELKKVRQGHSQPLAGRSIGLLFEKPSTRTRVSFEVAVSELGGHPVVLRSDELQLGRGEPLADTGKVLSRYLSAIVMRTFGQDRLEQLAEAATVPVINALSDLEHPCQALADVMTVAERFKDPRAVKFAYLGDGNNVCHSLMLAGAKAGWGEIAIACPSGFEPIEPILEQALAIGIQTGSRIRLGHSPVEAARGAQVLYTDVWTSMGQEAEQKERLRAFPEFQISADRVADAADNAIIMHCLPAHRGEEISEEVIDGPQSAVWDQAENRLHVQKALLEWLLKETKRR